MKSIVQLKNRPPLWAGFLLTLAALAAFPALAAAADVSYFIFGRAFSVYTPTDTVESESTAAIPGVILPEPEASGPAAAPVPLPGVTIEAYENNILLGLGRANREGFYNLSYMHAEENHTVRFLVFLDFADGTRERVGEVDANSSGDPIVVNNRLFSFNLEVPTESAVKAGTALFSPDNQFLFIEVGNLDMDDIFDQQQDPGDPTKWGLTKPPSPGHTLGPDFAFGGGLELYGLFGEASGARYYKINYAGPITGSITAPLYKKNYVIVGTGIEVHRTLMGPKTVTIGPVTLTDVYELDERLVGEPIPDHPGRFYSSYWTELGLRGTWNSGGGNPANDGAYVLSVEAWDELGNPVAPSTNNFATLNLRVVNTPPDSEIHNFQYLNGDIVLSDAAPCRTILLNRVTSPTFDDSLQLEITAQHPTGFFKEYSLQAWFGHDSFFGTLKADTTPIVNGVVVTPPALTYESCAYRFRLQVVPRITDGYNIVHIRENNWYTAINVLEP
jgi:hypothetical protein